GSKTPTGVWTTPHWSVLTAPPPRRPSFPRMSRPSPRRSGCDERGSTHMTAAQVGQGVAPQHAVGQRAAELRAPLRAPHSFTLRVPATSANLGPGYDSLGLALELRDEVHVAASPRKNAAAASVGIRIQGEGAQTLPTDASHLLVTVAEEILVAKG